MLERLKRFEKENRALRVFGWVLVASVVLSWVLIWLNAEKVTRWAMTPSLVERGPIQKLDGMVPQTEREKQLIAVLRETIVVPGTIIKVFTIRFLQITSFVLGVFMLGFAHSQQRLINLVKEATNAP